MAQSDLIAAHTVPMKVLIVGDYPPPYGGTSVQVSVLHELLSAGPGSTCRVLDIGKARHQRRRECLPARNGLEFTWQLLAHAARRYVLHLHTNGHNLKSWLITVACAAAGILNGRRTVVSLGSGLAPDYVEASSGATRLLVRAALRSMGAVICRNERTRAALVRLGMAGERVAIVAGFYGVKIVRSAPVPVAIEAFLRRRAPVLAAIASSGPEYGIPLFLEAIRRLRSLHPGLGVILIGPERPRDGILDGALLATGELPHEVVLAVMAQVAVFVRPTYFDGDASSVREALALGVPVVASDTDFRPDGTVLFRRGDVADLTAKLADVLSGGRSQDRGGPGTVSRSFEQLLSIYARLGGKPQSERGHA
jgi:glycogen synthase